MRLGVMVFTPHAEYGGFLKCLRRDDRLLSDWKSDCVHRKVFLGPEVPMYTPVAALPKYWL